MSNYVCFGDIIFLELNDEDILLSSGFFQPNLYFGKKENLCLKSFRNGLFKIYPNYSYKDSAQADQLKNQLNLLKSLENNVESLAYEALNNSIKEDYQLIESRQHKLKHLNNKIYEETIGTPIKFDQKIQLMHLESGQFLRIANVPNKADKSIVNIDLTDKRNRDLYFSFSPAADFTSQSEYVEYDAQVDLICSKNQFRLRRGMLVQDFDEIFGVINPETNKFSNDSTVFPLIEPRRIDPVSDSNASYAGLTLGDTTQTIKVRKFSPYGLLQEAENKNAFLIGDYVRIKNEDAYLTAYNTRDLKQSNIFFQNFQSGGDYKYNHLFSLFQIVKSPESAFELPVSDILNIDAENEKSYLLKHVISGTYLKITDEEKPKLELVQRDTVKNLESIRLEKDSQNKVIDHKSIVHLQLSSSNMKRGYLKKADAIPDKQDDGIEVNIKYFMGNANIDEYLDRMLRPDKYTHEITKFRDATASGSYFQFSVVENFEITSIFMVESYINCLQKFLDFLYNFIHEEGNQTTIRQFNRRILEIKKISEKFLLKLREQDEFQPDEEIVPSSMPNEIKQAIFREFRGYTLIFRIILELTSSDLILERLSNLVSPFKPGSNIPMERGDKGSSDKISYNDIVGLIEELKNIVVLTIQKNDLNHMCSVQFVRVSLYGIVSTNQGLFKNAEFRDRYRVRVIMLELAEKGLWDSDLDALGQLNCFEEELFTELENQESFHDIFIRLLSHVSQSKAPNLENTIRDNFILKFLQGDRLQHILPLLFESEGKIKVKFSRIKRPDPIEKSIEDLDESLSLSNLERGVESDEIFFITNYFRSALKLFISMREAKFSTLDFLVINYYDYHILDKAIRSTEQNENLSELRIILSEFKQSYFNNFLVVSFNKLPKQIQVIDKGPEMDKLLGEIQSFLKNSTETLLSRRELEYAKNQNFIDKVNLLQKKVSDEKSSDLLEMLNNSKNQKEYTIKKIVEIKVNVEVMRKTLINNKEIGFDFLLCCHECLVNWLQDFRFLDRESQSFLFDLLEVYGILEERIFEGAAKDIINALEHQQLLSSKMVDGTQAFVLFGALESMRQTFSLFEKEINPYSAKWKSRSRMYELAGSTNTNNSGINGSQNNQLDNAKDKFKIHSEETTIKNILGLMLLNQNSLKPEIINLMKRFSSFESLLYRELSHMAIISNIESLNDAFVIAKLTLRLDEISREMNFTFEQNINLSDEEQIKILTEVQEQVWKLLFLLYDLKKHFSEYEKDGENLKEKFIKLYRILKIEYIDIALKLKPEGIVTFVQKLFNIFKTSNSLVKTLNWVLRLKVMKEAELNPPQNEENQDQPPNPPPEFDKTILHPYDLLLKSLITTMTTLLYKNDECQYFYSNCQDFIHLYYQPIFSEYFKITPDVFVVFSEMMLNNKKLCKLPSKYLFDIVVIIYARGMKSEKIADHANDTYLSAMCMSLQFLVGCVIPSEIFDPLCILEEYWFELFNLDKFANIRLQDKTGEILDMDPNYYLYLEYFNALSASIDNFKSKTSTITDIARWSQLPAWVTFFTSKNFSLLFELKNKITGLIKKIYYDQEKKFNFIENSEALKTLIAPLVFDIILFMKIQNEVNNTPSSDFLNIFHNYPNMINTSSEYKTMDENLSSLDIMAFSKKTLRIYLNQKTLLRVLSEYIFGSCIDLLFQLLLSHAELAKEVVDRQNANFQNTMILCIDMIGDLVSTSNSTIENFPTEKFDKFFTKAFSLMQFFSYKDRLIEIAAKLNFKREAKASIVEQDHKKLTPVDHFNNYLARLLQTKKSTKELNLIIIAEAISTYSLTESEMIKIGIKDTRLKPSNLILNEFMKHIDKDIEKLDVNEVKFVLKLLRVYITRLNKEPKLSSNQEEKSTNEEEEEDEEISEKEIHGHQAVPIYEWEQAKIKYLKKIKLVQNYYQERGLTRILCNIFQMQNEGVFREAMLLSISYLYGGNLKVQEDFFNQFLDDENNLVLKKVYISIKDNWKSVMEKESLRENFFYDLCQKNLYEFYKNNKETKDHKINPKDVESSALRGAPSHLKREADKSKDGKSLIIAFTFLQTLCEGQFSKMQNFLREQAYEGEKLNQNFDFILMIRSFMNTYSKMFSRFNIKVGAKLVDLIIELIQGNTQDNITTLLGKTFIYDMCKILTDFNSRLHLLPKGFSLDPYDETFFGFKAKIINCFKIMLENKSEKNIEILKEHLDFAGLAQTLEDLMKKFLSQPTKDSKQRKDLSDVDDFIFELETSDFRGYLASAIDIYIIFRYAWPEKNEFRININQLIKPTIQKDFSIFKLLEKKEVNILEKTVYELFRKLVGSVEVVIKNREPSLIRVWFPKIAPCHYLHPDTQEYFFKHVDRSNTQTKLTALMDGTRSFIVEMETELKSRKRVLGLNSKVFYSLSRVFTNAIGVAINIIYLFSIDFDTSAQEPVVKSEAEDAVRALLAIQIGLSGLLVSLWFLLFYKSSQSSRWQKFVIKNNKAFGGIPPSIVRKLDESDDKKMIESFLNEPNDIVTIMNLAGPSSEEFKLIRSHPQLFKFIKYKYHWRNFLVLATSPVLLWHLTYLGICIGSFFHPVVCVFQIFDIAVRSDTIAQVFSAVSKNRKQFVWTLFLLGCTTLIYSTIGFFFMHSETKNDDNGNLCDRNIQCYLNYLNLGLRAGGGVADAIDNISYEAGVGHWFGRIVYDISFFIVVIILLLNLIFGMIIDAFGELRDLRTSNDDDAQNVCFMCGLERSEYEKVGKFDEHFRDDHNVWNYVYYIAYLIEKYKTSKNEMTDIENNVIDLYYAYDESWMPLGRRSIIYEESSLQNQLKQKSVEESVKESLEEFKSEISSELKKLEAQEMADEEADRHQNTGDDETKPLMPKGDLIIPKNRF